MIVDSNRGNLDYLEGELRELIESTEYKAYDLNFLSVKSSEVGHSTKILAS